MSLAHSTKVHPCTTNSFTPIRLHVDKLIRGQSSGTWDTRSLAVWDRLNGSSYQGVSVTSSVIINRAECIFLLRTGGRTSRPRSMEVITYCPLRSTSLPQRVRGLIHQDPRPSSSFPPGHACKLGVQSQTCTNSAYTRNSLPL